ncbi:MAG: hypothetical protein HYR60_18060 [Acidobacteria bacterium]|nr:hypothetical protein [Acidobacteriota bacterium]
MRIARGLVALAFSCAAWAQDRLYSGPQPGEPLPRFQALAATGPHAGREVDYIAEFGNSPILLIFIRDIDRNVYRTLWPCDRYASERPGLKTLFVYLAPDKVEGERRMRQVAKSLSLEVPVAASIEGVEGPGAYGLNRQVAVTAIVAKDGKVVANHAIVQPGASEAQRIIGDLTPLVWGRVPSDVVLALGPARRGRITDEMLEKTVAEDPREVAEAFARMSPAHATGLQAQNVIKDLKRWAGDNAERRRYLAARIPAILAICEAEEARAQLVKLKEELEK